MRLLVSRAYTKWYVLFDYMLSNLIIIIHLRQLRQLSRAFVKDEDVQGGVLKEAATLINYKGLNETYFQYYKHDERKIECIR